VQIDSTKLAGRNVVQVKMSGGSTGQVFIGNSSSVTTLADSTAPAIELRPGEFEILGLSTRASVWAKAASNGRNVSVVQLG